MTVGNTLPEGVAVLPRVGVAVVANNGSNNATVVDLTGIKVPVTVAVCQKHMHESDWSGHEPGLRHCRGDQHKFERERKPGYERNRKLYFQPEQQHTWSGEPVRGPRTPVAAAVDPAISAAVNPALNPGTGIAAVATASSQSTVDLLNMQSDSFVGRASGGALNNPSGVVFDPLNQVFLVANSLLNNVVFIDPNTFIETSARVGINPTSIDYNFQASTLVTVNSSSNILSVLDYVCPPNVLVPSCAAPQVRDVLGLGGECRSSSFVLEMNAIAIDPKMNWGALVDPDNNRVLLVPLPR